MVNTARPKGQRAFRRLWAAIPPAAAGTAQDAAEAAQRRAFLKWTQGEAMTPQEKQLVDDLWNTDPAKASEYWAAGGVSGHRSARRAFP